MRPDTIRRRRDAFAAVPVAIAALCAIARIGNSQVQFTYFVKTDSCYHGPPRRVQTGFRVVGVRGIVTALHGVADCLALYVENDDGKLLWGRPKLIKADIPNDVALLSSSELDAAPMVGFEVGDTAGLGDGSKVRAFGHPEGLKTMSTDLILHPPPTALGDLVPTNGDFAGVRDGLAKRNSPSLSTHMLNLQESLLPGHSGAPIVRVDNGRLIGIGNGGLLKGTIGHSWAVPWFVVSLDSLSSQQQSNLRALDPGGLFALDDSPPASNFPITVSRVDDGGPLGDSTRSMTTIVTLSASGKLDVLSSASARRGTPSFCGQAFISIEDSQSRTLAFVPARQLACTSASANAPVAIAWTVDLPVKVVARASSVVIIQSAVGQSAVILSSALGPNLGRDTAAGNRLPYSNARLTSTAHDYFEGSKHVQSQALLTDDGLLRVAARFENDDAIRGYRAHVEVTLSTASDSIVSVVRFASIRRSPKPFGKASCTDEFQQKQLSSDEVRDVTKLRVRTVNDGQFFMFPGVGRVCDEVPFRGLGLSVVAAAP